MHPLGTRLKVVRWRITNRESGRIYSRKKSNLSNELYAGQRRERFHEIAETVSATDVSAWCSIEPRWTRDRAFTNVSFFLFPSFFHEFNERALVRTVRRVVDRDNDFFHWLCTASGFVVNRAYLFVSSAPFRRRVHRVRLLHPERRDRWL